MLKLAVVAMDAAVSAVGAAEVIARIDRAAMPGPSPNAAVAMADPQAPLEAASISKAADGHYWAEADVDGHAIHFLVDTGATAVALTTTDAQRLGIETGTCLLYTSPSPRDRQKSRM